MKNRCKKKFYDSAFCPKLVSCMMNYSMKQLPKDVLAGVIVAVIAFPLSVALAISSGVTPERGLYSAIIGGFFVSLLGGSKVNIGGVTAATVMTVFTIVAKYGLVGLAITSIMAGVLLILMGILRVGVLLKYIPRTITLGFTAAIGVGIFTGQIKSFLGLNLDSIPVKNVDRIVAYAKTIGTIDFVTVAIGVLAVAILLLMEKFVPKIPNSLVAIIVTTLITVIFDIDTATIGSVYGEIPSHFPEFNAPKITTELIVELFPSALTLAILVAIVTLLACVVTDGLMGEKHNSNQELIAQGVANIFCGFFGAVPVAGAVARASNNVKNGGRTPIAGIVHSFVVLLILLLMMPLAEFIPMASLAAVLLVVAVKMCNFKEISYVIKKAPLTDKLVLVVTLLVGCFKDLLTAVEIGIVVESLLFLKNMADSMNVTEWIRPGEGKDDLRLKVIPKETFVYEIDGPMFFAAADKLSSLTIENIGEGIKTVILRMRSVPMMDATAVYQLENLLDRMEKANITVIFSHPAKQPYMLMERMGVVKMVGKENFRENIDAALEYAAKINAK
ncbi:MAG: SulP family inorganic anion transporter [Lachnospiraceae bacterium]|nr:SulP family inorganic anion transporter [Lachnospiraceae bacterium]